MTHRRVAVISGASRGLGLACARLLAERGFELVMLARGEAALHAAAAEIARHTGIDPLAVTVDVRDQAAVRRLGDAVSDRFGRADVLINNAGVLQGPKDFSHPEAASVLTADAAEVIDTLDVNVVGALRLAQVLVPMMRAQRWGRIVNVSSGMGQLAEMGGSWPGYRISKAGLNALTRILAAELAGSGIKVNSVCPGWCRTEMGGASANRSALEGAQSIVWGALIGDDGPSGGFFRDGRSIAW